MTGTPDFLQEAQKIKDEIIQLRRTIHQHPELGQTETETQKLVEAYLRKLGITTRRIAGTGVLGLLEGGKPGTTVGLRADMDALKIQERTGVPYASRRPGIMHACGHDCHTAGLLGAAKLLAAAKADVPGNVKFFFQPDEEGSGGAAPMIAAGGLENPQVTAMFGAHVNSGIPAGYVGMRPGKYYAASNPFDITIRGVGAHGAHPDLGVDAIAVACQAVGALQLCISRETDPVDAALISVCTFHAGNQRNALADEAVLTGIIRTLDPKTRIKTVAAVRRIVDGIAGSFGATAEINIHEGYPGLINDPAMTELARRSVGALLGEDKLFPITQPSLGTEDFGIFLEHVKGCFYQIGVANPAKTPTVSLHNSEFNVDEDALPILSAAHSQVAWDYLLSAI
ncbi:MAG: amidohydrolase [Peptococcaceae bacterium]|jgi:amidohydrolase|nr:amidohydrolase [Peptococcaceae bacterium]